MNTYKITGEEAEKINALPYGKKHPVRILIEEMLTGEILRVGIQDFNWRNRTPNVFCKQIAKAGKAKFMVKKIKAKTGWLIYRLQ